MKEILMVTEDKILVRKLQRDSDIYNLFPRGEYEEWEATPEDIKRINPMLYRSMKNAKKRTIEVPYLEENK